MSTKSAALDHRAGYTTQEIERYHDQQERSARRAPLAAGHQRSSDRGRRRGGRSPDVHRIRQHPGRPCDPGGHVHLDQQPGRAKPAHHPDRQPGRAKPAHHPDRQPGRPGQSRPGHRYLGRLMGLAITGLPEVMP